MPSSTYTKKISNMTTAEIKAKADADGLNYYRAAFEADRNNPQARYEYESYCQQMGVDPNPEFDRLKTLSRAQLATEWLEKGQAIEAQDLDAWRAQNALTFIASQPGYTVTPDNAAKMVAEMEARGLRGSVMNLQLVFDSLVKHGDIQAAPQPPAPVRLLSEEEMRLMPLNQLKDYIDAAGRNGIL